MAIKIVFPHHYLFVIYPGCVFLRQILYILLYFSTLDLLVSVYSVFVTPWTREVSSHLGNQELP